MPPPSILNTYTAYHQMNLMKVFHLWSWSIFADYFLMKYLVIIVQITDDLSNGNHM